MKDCESLDSFRSSLDANYDWPCLFPFKFIVPKDQCQTVLDLFADDPVKSNESSSGRFIGFTMEMNMHSSDEVIAIYQRVPKYQVLFRSNLACPLVEPLHLVNVVID